MACGVCRLCTHYSKPFIPTSPKENLRGADASLTGKFSQKSTLRTATQSSNNPIIWAKLKISNLPGPTGHLHAPDTSWLTLISGFNQVVICGYWMGPEFDDGWGYVEAAVYQIY